MLQRDLRRRGACAGISSLFWQFLIVYAIDISPANTMDSLKSKNTNVTVIARISPRNPDPSGIAISQDGKRVFLGFPRHADNHASFALAELLPDGDLVPFPAKSLVYPRSDNTSYQEWLVSPHGLYMDANDVLWVLDDGKRDGIPEIPTGAAKVVGIDINTRMITTTLVIPSDVMSNDSHLNDLRVDQTHGRNGTVYIANSGFGKRYSLIVADIATGQCREVLRNHVTTSPESGFMTFLEGQPLVLDLDKPTFPIGGADGIALSPNGRRLYWTVISGRRLYSIPTDILSNFSTDESAIAEAVKFEGDRPACDGIVEDEMGNLYFGAFEQRSLVKRTVDGQYQLLVHDEENFGWPDGLAYRKGFLYVTLGQWNRLASFNNGTDLRRPPYLVVQVKV